MRRAPGLKKGQRLETGYRLERREIIFARASLGGLTAAGCLLLAAFDVEVTSRHRAR